MQCSLSTVSVFLMESELFKRRLDCFWVIFSNMILLIKVLRIQSIKIMKNILFGALVGLSLLLSVFSQSLTLADLKNTSVTQNLGVLVKDDNTDSYSKKRCCRTTHEVFVVDDSQEMNTYPQFKDYTYAHIRSHFGYPDYMSTAFFGGASKTSQPFFTYIDLLHKLNADGISYGGYSSGGTLYDDALNLAMKILSQNYSDQTTIVFLSPGTWKLKDFSLINQFNKVKDSFVANTGCRVKVLCYYRGGLTDNQVQYFRAMCDKIDAFFFKNV